MHHRSAPQASGSCEFSVDTIMFQLNRRLTKTPMASNLEYTYRGALSLVKLHERYMRKFLEAWKAAKKLGISLPKTNDPNYVSMEQLLLHVLSCARSYMVWMCEKLDLPDPGISSVPPLDGIESAADAYLEHVLERWRFPMSEVPEERFFDRAYISRWDAEYCIEAMMEHAVMHPIRHRFQLLELIHGS